MHHPTVELVCTDGVEALLEEGVGRGRPGEELASKEFRLPCCAETLESLGHAHHVIVVRGGVELCDDARQDIRSKVLALHEAEHPRRVFATLLNIINNKDWLRE